MAEAIEQKAGPELVFRVSPGISGLTWFFRACSIALSGLGGWVIGTPLGVPPVTASFTGVMVLMTFLSLDYLQKNWRDLKAVAIFLLCLFVLVGMSWNIYSDLSGGQFGVAKFVDTGEAAKVKDDSAVKQAAAAKEAFERAVSAERRAEAALLPVQDEIAAIVALTRKPPEERDRQYSMDVRALQGRIGAKPDGVIGEQTGLQIELYVSGLRAQEAQLLTAYLSAQAARNEAEAKFADAEDIVQATAGSDNITIASDELTASERLALPVFITFVIELFATTLKLAFGRWVPAGPKRRRFSEIIGRKPRYEPPDLSAARPPARADQLALATTPGVDGSWRRPMGDIDEATREAAEAAARSDRMATERRGAPVVDASSAMVARTLMRGGAEPKTYDVDELKDPEAALRLRRGAGKTGGEPK